ncbi:MAG: helix-turn-helix transcriptional regulator [Alphaproteobacteria bacterium]|nr:helix-turn-helix transcriptional regulator [Alphaproteobacteria bacterium]
MQPTFAERLKTAMEQAHINQSDLSARTGFSKAAISQYLSGKNTPASSRITAMADVLNVSPDYLKGYDVPAPNPNAVTMGNIKITMKQTARCLRKSEAFVKDGLARGILPFGNAVQGTGNRLNYFINPVKLREYVGADRFDAFFSMAG